MPFFCLTFWPTTLRRKSFCRSIQATTLFRTVNFLTSATLLFFYFRFLHLIIIVEHLIRKFFASDSHLKYFNLVQFISLLFNAVNEIKEYFVASCKIIKRLSYTSSLIQEYSALVRYLLKFHTSRKFRSLRQVKHKRFWFLKKKKLLENCKSLQFYFKFIFLSFPILLTKKKKLI